MFPVLSGRRALILACAVLMAVAMVVARDRPDDGMFKGKVVDAKGAPVEAAKITIELKDGDPAHLRGEDQQEG